MVNADSDLFRAHPDWVLGVPGRLPPECGASRCSTSPTRTASPTCSSASTRCWASTTSRSSSGITTATSSTRAVPRPDARRLPAPRRAPRAPPGRRDRELRVGRRAGRPRHPRAHRPRVGERHQRRARAPGDPALDRAAAGAGAGRRPRRPAARAHHGAHARPLVPRGDGAVRPLRVRVGRQRGVGRGAGRDRGGDRVLQAGAGAAARRRGRARRPPRPGGVGPRRGGGGPCRVRLRATHVERDRGARRGPAAGPRPGADVPRRAGAPGRRAADAAHDAAAVAGVGCDLERPRAGDRRPADAGAGAGASVTANPRPPEGV